LLGICLVVGIWLGGAELQVLGALAAAASLTCGITAILAGKFHRSLFASHERTVSVYLPVPNAVYFRYCIENLLRASVLLLLPLGVGYGYAVVEAALAEPASAELWALGAVMLSVAQAVALAMLLLVWGRKWNRPWAALALFAVAAVIIFIPANLSQIVQVGALLLPPGWIALAYNFGVLKGHTAGLFLLLPASGVLVPGALAYRKLKDIYEAVDFQILPHLYEQFSDWDEGNVDAAPGGEKAERSEPTWFEMRDRLLAGRFREVVLRSRLLAPADWKGAGWIESLAGRWLSPREKALAEFFLASELGGWSRHWRIAVKWAGPASIVALPFVPVPGWLGVWAALITALAGLPLGGGRWIAFGGRWSSGVLLPLYSAFPVGYAEVSRMILKVNFIRIAAWSPMLVVAGWLLGLRIGLPTEQAVPLGFKCLIILMAGQPLLVAGRFSSCTNDTRSHLLESAAVVSGFLLCVIGFFVPAIMLFFVPVAASLVCAAVFSAFSAGCWLGYGFLYNRGRVDLTKIPRAE